MSEDVTLQEIVRTVRRIEHTLSDLRRELQHTTSDISEHDTQIALLKEKVGGWSKWSSAGILALVTGVIEWFVHGFKH